MWGHLCTELTNFQNFNVSFSTHKSEVLIHLSQWQYWWWFWFSFFWTFYFFVILRVVKHRVFKMNITINTSFRSRGKWGDYLVTLIPLSWCLNILLNSNFILRMIEWQSESGAILIRIHGKQWYWVYKYDTTSIFTALELQKNIGNNRWGGFINKDGGLSERYVQTVFLKNRNTTQQEYWTEVDNKELNPSSTFSVYAENPVNNNQLSTALSVAGKQQNPATSFIRFTGMQNAVAEPYEADLLRPKRGVESFLHEAPVSIIPAVRPPHIVPLESLVSSDNLLRGFESVHSLSFYENSALDDSWEVYSNILVQDSYQPFRLLPTVQTHNNQAERFNIITPRLVDANDVIVEKPEENVEFLVIKQKRYKRKQNISMYSKQDTANVHGFEPKKLNKTSEQTARFFKNNYFFQQISQTGAKNPFDFYSAIKLGRARAETFSINLSRRLLRTTRTLVLPAYTNISIIANSYDVVHSWFIPGLGLKIDCVPGKSTHHSLYIDNVGLYYGQCAEICGRYHHHMPIRICALPFDHFIVWWTAKGLPKALKMKYDAKKLEQSMLVKYCW